MQRAYNRDGIEAFSFNCVQTLEEYDKEVLFDLEDEYISAYVAKDLAYNIAMARGGRKYATIEEKEKASENYRRAQLSYIDSLTPEEIKEIYGKGKLGKPLSESRKKHLSDFWKGKPKSEETKQRMRHSQSNPSPEFDAKRRQTCAKTGKSNIGKIPKNAVQIVFNGELFQSIKLLSNHLSLCYGTFSQAIKQGGGSKIPPFLPPLLLDLPSWLRNAEKYPFFMHKSTFWPFSAHPEYLFLGFFSNIKAFYRIFPLYIFLLFLGGGLPSGGYSFLLKAGKLSVHWIILWGDRGVRLS